MRTYLCNKCFDIIMVVSDDCREMKIHGTKHNKHKLISTNCTSSQDEISIYEAKEYGKKSQCNGTMIEIDSQIIISIQKLNKLGVETEYCCEGHLGSFCFYVRFKNKCFFNKILPKTLLLLDGNQLTSKYVNEQCISSYEILQKNLKSVYDFNEWVENLDKKQRKIIKKKKIKSYPENNEIVYPKSFPNYELDK